MAWVNLNDVYVNKTGGTITGDLTVNGSIKVNNGKGDGGIYNVANEITTLRDSVSQVPIKEWKILSSSKISGTWGQWNEDIHIAYNGTSSDWTFIPIQSCWCTIEEIKFDSNGIIIRINPTYTSSAIQVKLLALRLK